MKNNSAAEKWVYSLVVALSLLALWLTLNAPENYLDARAVYRNF